MRRRGIECPRLVVGDGHLGIWGALRNVYPAGRPSNAAGITRSSMCSTSCQRESTPRPSWSYATYPTPRLATRASASSPASSLGATSVATRSLLKPLSVTGRMVTFYGFFGEHWQHLRTTNPVEPPFAALRLRTDAAKRYKGVDRATAVIWKMLMVAEKALPAPQGAGPDEGCLARCAICRRTEDTDSQGGRRLILFTRFIP